MSVIPGPPPPPPLTKIPGFEYARSLSMAAKMTHFGNFFSSLVIIQSRTRGLDALNMVACVCMCVHVFKFSVSSLVCDCGISR